MKKLIVAACTLILTLTALTGCTTFGEMSDEQYAKWRHGYIMRGQKAGPVENIDRQRERELKKGTEVVKESEL